MQACSYPSQYQQLQALQTHSTDPYKLYLVKQHATGCYRMAKKTSIYSCSDISQDELLNEVKILKQLDHPHIIKYYDVFLEQDDFVLILEFCEEGDLEYYTNRRKDKEKKDKKEGFSEKLILSWVLQILMGLQYIHSKNIIHRMVSSHNIYMNHQGDLKLGSFGGAKILQDTMAKAMTVVGAPCNLSPQIVEGKAYDSKIDIWGLGCIVYELATFQHPFKMTSLPQLYEMIVKTPPQDLPLKYSKYLNPIYKKMMKKNPAYRPSASQLLHEQVFIKLMSEYTKKKKIDSLDLREVTPKQLLTHRKNKTLGKLLPPLPNAKNVGMSNTDSKIKTPITKKKNSQGSSKSREKDTTPTITSPRLPSISGRTGQTEDQNPSNQKSPKDREKQKEQANLPAIQKDKISPKPAKNKQASQVDPILEPAKQKVAEPKQKQKQQTNRLTLPDLMQGQYISLLCQIKLELLQKKYSPNMSQIFEQTIEFQQYQ